MKKVFFIVFLCSLIRAGNSFAQEKPYEHHSTFRLITSDEIIKSGAIKLSDVFNLTNNWNISSVNGYDYSINANGLSSYQEQDWKMMLDGQIINFEIFDDKSINNIPIDIYDIDYIKIYSYPVIVNGEFFGEGLISIHSKEDSFGLNAKGKIYIGSETNEPGPYRYINKEPMNVDNIGTNYSMSLSYRSKNFFAGGNFKRNTDVISQEEYINILASILPADNKFPRLKLNSSSLKLGHFSEISRVNAFGSLNEIKDFYFFEPIGRMFPLKNRYSIAGLSGNLKTGNKFEINYKGKFERNELLYVQNTANLDFNWRQNNISGDVAVDYVINRYNFQSGIGFRNTSIENPSVSDDKYNIYKLYSAYTKSFRKSYHTGGVLVNYNEKNIGYKGFSSNTFFIKTGSKISAILSHSKDLPEEGNSFWYWVQRGYNFLDENNITYNIDGELKTGEKITIDIEYFKTLSKLFDVMLLASFRNFHDIYLIDQNFVYNDSTESFESPINVATKQSGNVIGGGVILKHRIMSDFIQEIRYNYLKDFSGDDLFSGLWQRYPQHRVGYIITFDRIPSFTINGKVTYMSPTYWSEYSNIDASSGGRYSPDVGDFLSVDLAFIKGFLFNKIRTSLILKNIFDRSNQLNPIGRKNRFTFYFRGEVLFNSIF